MVGMAKGDGSRSVKRSPEIIIDGRQTYQAFGPWSWLAGNYPHPTGNDEQPESFVPYPDLHFDRVSANRTRFVNYWYRNYQFAPTEIVPGYMTHQTERNINLPADAAAAVTPQGREIMYTTYTSPDWDYLGYRYSVISSISNRGWNNRDGHDSRPKSKNSVTFRETTKPG